MWISSTSLLGMAGDIDKSSGMISAACAVTSVEFVGEFPHFVFTTSGQHEVHSESGESMRELSADA